MSVVHDLGGRPGFGPVERERNEPTFHARWEGRVCGLASCAIGYGWIELDAFRHGIERMDPARYLRASYYEHWLASLETVLREAGVLERGFRAPLPESGHPFAREVSRAPRFAVGDVVRTGRRAGGRHTRLPGYAARKRGVVVRVHGAFVFPDTNAHGEGEQPQHLYTVRFAARELWGEQAEPAATVCIDLFEPYLEAVSGESEAETRDVA
jgi:nitrile hydratase